MLPRNPLGITAVPSEKSAESLDLKSLLADAPSDNILAASLSFLSSISIVHSFSSIPTFPSQEASTPLFLNVVSSPTPDECHTITIPTQPRLKAMLMEPIVVERWTMGLPSKLSPVEVPESIEDAQEIPPWIPEGRILPPQAPSKPSTCASKPKADANIEDPINVDVHSNSLCVEISFDEQKPVNDIVPAAVDELPGAALDVPTIMLSNSSAAVSLSLESSQSLAPLAVRRGHKAPAPLNLSPHKNTEDGLYPGIPSPFLGSPATYSPKFELGSNPVDPSLDLNALCQDLRSRCPALRPESPLSPAPPVSPGNTSTGSAYNELDSDDWAFAADFLEQHANTSFQLDPQLPETPLKAVPDILGEPLATSTPEIDSYSWSSDPTLTNSPDSPGSPEQAPVVDKEIPLQSDANMAGSGQEANKQQRRRTVIIETPRNSMIEGAKPTRVTIDLSHLATADKDGDETLSHEMHEPIPFETPRSRSNTVSTAFSERPMSSASMRAPPRGILKSSQKKSVRFSVMPSMHEYPEDDETTEPESYFDTAKDGDSEGRDRNNESLKLNSRGRKRASSEPQTAAKRRQSMSVAEKPNRTSFPKHPAIRSLVRGSTPSPSPAPRSSNAGRQSLPGVLVARNVDKTEVGSPIKLLKRPQASSTPSPLDRQSNKRASSGRESFGRKPSPNKENMARRASEVVPVVKTSGGSPKGRIKSIFTKFRAQ
ncbi:hypothetical protein EIP86_004617 [Pleurotus ostreatoroseus]|nr:hypothetical protein EIP86_004617 [Pleurotus ostreatoroseus]